MFINVLSGPRFLHGELPALEDAARTAGLEVIHLARDLDVPGIVRDHMRRGRGLFVAAGGDGTINSVIQALVNSDAVLGVIPIGTFNPFARDLGLPLDWRKALEIGPQPRRPARRTVCELGLAAVTQIGVVVPSRNGTPNFRLRGSVQPFVAEYGWVSVYAPRKLE